MERRGWAWAGVRVLSATFLQCSDRELPSGPSLLGVGDWDPEWIGPAAFFAPVIYQDVAASAADYLARFTFDEDWSGGNNWDNTFAYPLGAWVYVSMVETTTHYFIHYGTFHPRDWCESIIPACSVSTLQHENDLEGLSIVVDKRFATTDWPYGQVHTIELIHHNSTYPAYRNCSFTGYQVTPSASFKVARPPASPQFDGCVTWVADEVAATAESPPARVAVFVQAKGHGVEMRSASWGGFPGGDGVIYWPSDFQAEVPSGFTDPEVLYQLQWVHQNEYWLFPMASLWSKRLSSGGLYTSAYYTLLDDPVAPFDVQYGYRFNCYQQPCGALAPWGQKKDNISTVRRGDWHNHPAWAWSQHYEPGPTFMDTLLYPYCRLLSCRSDSSVYITNMFWDDSAATQDNIDLSRSVDFALEGDDSRDAVAMHVPEVRWDFDESFGGAQVDAAAFDVSLVTEPDSAWGYSGGAVRMLRLEGAGVIRITLAVPAESESEYNELIARVRFSQSQPTTTVGRFGDGPPAARPDTERQNATWRILRWRLNQLREAGMLGDRVVLTFDVGVRPQRIDIDFVVMAP